MVLTSPSYRSALVIVAESSRTVRLIVDRKLKGKLEMPKRNANFSLEYRATSTFWLFTMIIIHNRRYNNNKSHPDFYNSNFEVSIDDCVLKIDLPALL